MAPNDPQPELRVVDCRECLGTGVEGKQVCYLCGGFGWIAAPQATAECPAPTRPEVHENPQATGEKAGTVDWEGEPFMPDVGRCL